MFGSSSSFLRLVEKSTSQLLLEPDWDSTLQICDCIRQGDVQAKYALQTIKKKISQDNPHVSMFALHVLESCVKNCGAVFHVEVATKDFMEFLKDLVKVRPDPVKAKILELVQVWSQAFRNEPNYKIVQDTFHMMKMEGNTFPQLKEADAMFMADKAPEWIDGECCHRCRVGFSTFQRKHHCRHCGNVFCNKCSAKNSIIPKFGLEREVRVCDSCYDDINGPSDGKKDEENLPQEYLNSPLSKQTQKPAAKSDQEIQEEEELQLALALSMSEQKDKGRSTVRSTPYSSSNTNASSNNAVYAQPVLKKVTNIDTTDIEPELARYLNRNYWQQKHEEVKPSTTQPSAPLAAVSMETKTQTITTTDKIEEKYQNGETSGDEEEFLNALRSSVEIIVNRMGSNSARGRSIATDSSVQTLFMTINAMHPELMKHLSGLEESRSHFETLQDKLAQLKDARDALDALRDEHREKRRREAEEMERQRQIQMALKLDILRQKKQEYLEYQRQMALQRMQEQEREMQMRLEQQKQQQQMRAIQYTYPQMYNNQPQTYSPGGSTEGSPLHHAGAPYTQMPGGMPGAPGAPGGQMPLGAQMLPGQMPPGGQMPPPGQMPPGQMPQGGQLPPGSVPGGAQLPHGSMPPGSMPPGSMPPGSMPPGSMPPVAGLGPNPSLYNQPQAVPAGYQQLPPGAYPSQTYTNVPGQYPAPTSQPMGQPGTHPAMGQPGTQSAMGQPGTQSAMGQPSTQPAMGQPGTQQPPQSVASGGMEYQNFNMQNMASALPGQGAPQAGHGVPPQQQIPSQQPYMGAPQAQGQYLPPGAQPIQQQPPGAQPMQQQPVQQPPATDQQPAPPQEQQPLISF